MPEVVHMIVSAAACNSAFFSQSIVEVGVKAWPLGLFSTLAALDQETAIATLRKRYVLKSQRHMVALRVAVLFILLA